MSPLEIKGAMAAVITSVVILVGTFTAGGICRNRNATETQPGTKPLAAENLAVNGRSFFFQSCAHCHGRDADGGEDAPSLLKLQISGFAGVTTAEHLEKQFRDDPTVSFTLISETNSAVYADAC